MGFRVDQTVKVSKFPDQGLRVQLAQQLNWNSSGKVAGVRDQGRCGSCWAFATAATYESYIAIRTGRLLDLSEEYLTQCTPNSNCANGGYLNLAF